MGFTIFAESEGAAQNTTNPVPEQVCDVIDVVVVEFVTSTRQKAEKYKEKLMCATCVSVVVNVC